MCSVGEVRAQALEVAAGWSPPGAPPSWRLTAALFRVIAAHDELLAKLSALPADRLPALLASAAVSFLVRRDRPEPLGRYFPEPGQAQPGFDDGFAPAASGFISDRLRDIVAECAQRRYQMNEVARSTQIALGVTVAAGSADQIGLVDLGTGAGLGLQLDRYRYRVGGLAACGPADATLTLTCEPRGPAEPPPIALPLIAGRAGIEVAPVDLEDPGARSWLLACTPPEASALSRLAAAIEVSLQHPADIRADDVLTALPDVLDQVAPGSHIVVTDAYLAVFLSAGARAELARILASASRGRPVTWLSLDPLVPLGPAGRDSVQDLVLPEPLVRSYQRDGVFAVLGAVTFAGGKRRSARLLARAHPSGEWVEWLA